ncbi:tetratricopeptide repeat protein [Thiobaca trueperi]|uniref:Flp pilus assembly protein TadD n=1 Tax=Thiobaca trueperi TaxID=127458 RepID=A0A4V2V1Y9_9GAMM|nr:tetratricopeptide repeat protein [Thiobaca trueperi]TCT23002.1 Flp pilus assembly protein TadD [Thiobaca trueperi]
MTCLTSRLFSAGLAAILLLPRPDPALALADPAPPASMPVAMADAAASDVAAVTGLDADQVYAILVAEIAGRRGDMATAFVNYLQAARLTRSPLMAELALRAAVSSNDDQAAAEGVNFWLELAPDAPSAHQVAAFLRIKAEDREGALTHLARLVELSAGAAESVYAQSAAIVARVPNPDQRVALMQALISRFPESADAQQSLALVAASAARLEIAERAARRALELRPDWNQPRLFLVKLLLSENKRAEARALLEAFVSQSPGDQSLHMLYGQFLVDEQEFTTAREVFGRLLLNHPNDPDALFAVGLLSLQLNDLDGARTAFTRLYDSGERRGDAAFYLAQTAERAENVQDAIDWYGKVDGANAADAQIRLALLRARSGEIAQAREIIQRLRDDVPDNAIALYLVEAEILDEVGRADESMAVYDAALAAYPDDLNLLYARALHAVKRDQIQLAERDFRRILKAEPEHADALNALGYTLADRTNRYHEARGYIEKAYALKPDEPAILDSMGWVYYRLGDYEKAHDYLRRALDKLDDGEIAAHLGEVLWAMERRTEAWSVWDAAMKAHPENDYLQAVIGRYRLSKTDVDPNAAGQQAKPKDGVK